MRLAGMMVVMRRHGCSEINSVECYSITIRRRTKPDAKGMGLVRAVLTKKGTELHNGEA